MIDAPVIGKELEMKELYWEGVATHPDPESWRWIRKGPVQALTGAPVGWAIEPRKPLFGGADTVVKVAGNTATTVLARSSWALRGRRPHARRETLWARTGRPRSWPRRGAGVRSGKPKGVSH